MKHSFYVPQDKISNGKVFFSSEQKKKISNVLRLKDKDFVRVCDGLGNEYKTNAKSGDFISHSYTPKNKKIFVRIILSLSKLAAFEQSLEKCVEIGVDEILPVISQRSVVKIKDVEKKTKRFYDIIISAFCQCKMLYLPIFNNICSDLNRIPLFNGAKAVLYEEEKNNTFKSFLEKNKNLSEITLFFGPEGGIEKSEIELMNKQGFEICKLTENILRCDTAVIFTLSNVNFFYNL